MSTVHYNEILPVLGIITPILNVDELGANSTQGRIDVGTTGFVLNADGNDQKIAVKGSDGTSEVSIEGDGVNTVMNYIEQIDTAAASGSKVIAEIVNDSGGSVPVISVELERADATAELADNYIQITNGSTEELSFRYQNLSFNRTGYGTGILYPALGFIQTFFMSSLSSNVYMVREATANTPASAGYIPASGKVTDYCVCLRNSADTGNFEFLVTDVEFDGTLTTLYTLTLAFASPDITFVDALGATNKCYYGKFNPPLSFISTSIALYNNSVGKSLTGTVMLHGYSSGFDV